MNQAVAKFISYLEKSKIYVESIIKKWPSGSDTVQIDGIYLELREIQ